MTAPHAGRRRYCPGTFAPLPPPPTFVSVCPSNQVNNDFIKGGEFTLERMGVTYRAKAHIRSPFDPENKRVKGVYE